MPDPVAPARYAHPDDVNVRYVEGTIPASARSTSPVGKIQTRIIDVEDALIGLVPSLDVDPATLPERRRRAVQALVCDKVLELYRNPSRSSSRSQSMDGFTESTVFSRESEKKATIAFTAEELNRVRASTRRRNLGMARVAPWMRPC